MTCKIEKEYHLQKVSKAEEKINRIKDDIKKHIELWNREKDLIEQDDKVIAGSSH